MTPESIIVNVLEQVIALKKESAIFMLSGNRVNCFAKGIDKTVPLFAFPSDRFFFACNLLLSENQFEETRHVTFSPNTALRLLRVSSPRISKATNGKDLVLTTLRTGRTQYQMMWYVTYSHKELKQFEDERVASEINIAFEGQDPEIESQSDTSYGEIEKSAIDAHEKYERLIRERDFYIMEYDGESVHSSLSGKHYFSDPYILTIMGSHSSCAMEGTTIDIDVSWNIQFPHPPYIQFSHLDLQLMGIL